MIVYKVKFAHSKPSDGVFGSFLHSWGKPLTKRYLRYPKLDSNENITEICYEIVITNMGKGVKMI